MKLSLTVKSAEVGGVWIGRGGGMNHSYFRAPHDVRAPSPFLPASPSPPAPGGFSLEESWCFSSPSSSTKVKPGSGSVSASLTAPKTGRAGLWGLLICVRWVLSVRLSSSQHGAPLRSAPLCPRASPLHEHGCAAHREQQTPGGLHQQLSPSKTWSKINPREIQDRHHRYRSDSCGGAECHHPSILFNRFQSFLLKYKLKIYFLKFVGQLSWFCLW